MKTVKFIPSICKGENAKWVGHVVMRVPSFDEKFAYIEELGMSEDEEGNAATKSSGQKLKYVRSIVSLSAKHYVEVDLKSSDGSIEVKSFEDMQYEEDLHAALIEVGSCLINGFKVGNG